MPLEFCDDCMLDISDDQIAKMVVFVEKYNLDYSGIEVTENLETLIDLTDRAEKAYLESRLSTSTPYSSFELVNMSEEGRPMDENIVRSLSVGYNVLNWNFWHVVKTGHNLLGKPYHYPFEKRKFLLSLRTLLLEDLKLCQFTEYRPRLERELTRWGLVPVSSKDLTADDEPQFPITGNLYFKSPGKDEQPDIPVKLACPWKHMFSLRAILHWLEFRNSCPLCRAVINQIKISLGLDICLKTMPSLLDLKLLTSAITKSYYTLNLATAIKVR